MKKIAKWIFILSILGILFLIASAKFFTKETLPLEKADVIVVLGSPSQANGKTSAIQRSRVDKGVEIYNKGLANKILFTGGAVGNNIVESETMKKYAIRKGIPASNIFTETKSSNTDENVSFSFEIIKTQKFKKVIVVTSTYHTRRARHLFSHLPLKIQTKAAPYPENMKLLTHVLAVLNEWYGYLRHHLDWRHDVQLK